MSFALPQIGDSHYAQGYEVGWQEGWEEGYKVGIKNAIEKLQKALAIARKQEIKSEVNANGKHPRSKTAMPTLYEP